MTYDDAVKRARTESKNGYVQHVNKSSHAYTPEGEPHDYIVADWYDHELTVMSFENGKALFIYNNGA